MGIEDATRVKGNGVEMNPGSMSKHDRRSLIKGVAGSALGTAAVAVGSTIVTGQGATPEATLVAELLGGVFQTRLLA